ncbi:MAG: DnaA ATPase domain-containing protein [Paraclostridium sp.]
MGTTMKDQLLNNLKKPEASCKVESKYKCEKCRDLTFIIKDDYAYECECRVVKQAENILKNSGISKAFRNKTFDNFNYAINMHTVSAFTKANEYVGDFETIKEERCNSIMFIGAVGSGKTHLSLAIANDLMDKHIGVVYMPYRETITNIKQCVMEQENYNRIMNRYKRAKVLLIDDLFKGGITNSDINIMFEIINYRYFNHKPMIISSEKNAKELLKIDEAIGSRVIEMSSKYLVDIIDKNLNYRI